MDSSQPARSRRDLLLIKALTCTMFFTFAMTTDAVGSIIPTLLTEFELSLRAASAFHYAPMIAIAVGALCLGFLADRVGRKRTIVIGLALYGLSSLLFAFGSGFGLFVVLLAAGGVGISVFKIGALALIGGLAYKAVQNYQQGKPLIGPGQNLGLTEAPSGSGFESGAVMYINKPFTANKLLTIVNTMLESGTNL